MRSPLLLSLALFLSGALPVATAADALPPGKGQELMVRMCVGCHGLETVTDAGVTKELWPSTVDDMITKGAQGTEQEIEIVIAYLEEHFSASEATPPAVAAKPRVTPSSQPKADNKPVGGAPTEPNPPETEWRTYGQDSGSNRFSPLMEINPHNVGRLKLAWSYHMKPEGAAPATPAPRGPHPEQSTRSRMRDGRFRSSTLTPLVVNGKMYITSPYGRVSALDPTTGEEIWTYALPSSSPTSRGLEFWAGDGKTPGQVVFGSNDGKLYSVSAETGEPNLAFGDNGILNINTEDIMRGLPGRNRVSSPPHVYKNLVIVGGSTQEVPAIGPAGDIRAFDMRTGKKVWTFHSIPREGEPFNDTWEGDSWRNRTGVNVWGLFTVDAERGILYIPFGAPSVDQYGGDRGGDNLFGTSLVAVNAKTGKYLWHFQAVHHDIWDADFAAAPVLVDVKRDGETIPAVAALTKVALLFILNRETGEPIFGVEERPVEKSNIPLEKASPTQPFPIKPEPLSRLSVTKDEIVSVTPELKAACLEKFGGARFGGPYMPPGYNRLSVRFPGNHGGVNWGGMSYSPELGYLFINTSELGQVSGMQDHDPESGRARAAGRGNRVEPSGPYKGVEGAGGRFSVEQKGSPQQLPCQEPPWGRLTAVDVSTGEFVWRVPLGITESFPPELQKTGRPGNGGTIVTGGGLVFVAATDDARFRAFDAKTGEELWTQKLKGAAQAVPISYLGADKRQYIAITATGGGFFNNPTVDDSILAFTLDGASGLE